MQGKPKSIRPITAAFDNTHSLVQNQMSKSGPFNKQLSFQQTEEFKKQTSKPFQLKKKEVSQSFNSQPTADVILSDIDSLRSSLQQIENSQREKKGLLQNFMDESQSKYNFPQNFDEIVNISASQVRSKKNFDQDMISVYSSINNIEFEFKENQNKEIKDISRNLKKIKQLEEILNQKEEEYQNLMKSRIESSQITEDNQSEISMISDKSSQKNNMFITAFKQKPSKIQNKINIQENKKKEEITIDNKQIPKEIISGPNYIQMNKIIQKREDKYILTPEQMVRVDEILQQNQPNIYKELQDQDQTINMQLINAQKELIQIYPQTEPEKIQPKDTFILKQKEENQLRKDAAHNNDQLMVLFILQKQAMKNPEQMESKQEIRHCLDILIQQEGHLVTQPQQNIEEIIQKIKVQEDKLFYLYKELVQMPEMPIQDIPIIMEEVIVELEQPQELKDQLQHLYSQEKQNLQKYIDELEESIRKQDENMNQLPDLANDDDYTIFQIEQTQENTEFQLETLEEVIRRIEGKSRIEPAEDDYVQTNLNDSQEETQQSKEYHVQNFTNLNDDDTYYDADRAIEELKKMGVDWQQTLKEIQYEEQNQNIQSKPQQNYLLYDSETLNNEIQENQQNQIQENQQYQIQENPFQVIDEKPNSNAESDKNSENNNFYQEEENNEDIQLIQNLEDSLEQE